MSVFEGMAGLLNDVFGGPVTLIDVSAEEGRVVQAVFREEPIEVAGENGGLILIEAPTLQVPAPLAVGIEHGDQVQPGNGRTYRIESTIPSRSPAADRFRVFTLELVS